jgi:hypothetical protein
MIQIRKNTFETNSSSTHSIVINTNDKRLPGYIDFRFGEFGWECGDAPAANYLYTAIMNNYDKDEALEWIEYLKSVLDENGVQYEFETPEWSVWKYGGDDRFYCKNAGYIDHSSELTDMLDDMKADKELLIAYLSNAGVYTHNDNLYSGEENYAYSMANAYNGVNGYVVYEKGN